MANASDNRRDLISRIGVGYLLVQGVAAAAWWATLLLGPESRVHFLAPGAPEVTLLAFLLPDVVLFAGASVLAAAGLARKAAWAWPVLCAHAGAGAYAALYCLSLTAMTGGGAWPGAVLMAPSLVVPPWLAWRLRPGREPAGRVA